MFSVFKNPFFLMFIVVTAVFGYLMWHTITDRIALKRSLFIINQKLAQDNILLNSKVNNLTERNDTARRLLGDVFGRGMTSFTTARITVTVTAYTASVDETNDDPHHTAYMTPSRIGIVALSRDLRIGCGLDRGDVIILKGYGAFMVEDKMSTHKNKGTDHPTEIRATVDILHATKKAAKLFGVKRAVEMTFVY